ncbi:MAG: hypothetical protein U9R75_12340, partial [Candidatus Thermoplasmatota archaeon]|nr:hypothetical protein [Candidatus Thermoplasmatota archaeon]
MQTRCERVDISTGGEKVVFFPDEMAVDMDIHPMDRVELINVKDVTQKITATAQFFSLMHNRVGLCRELADEMGIHNEGFISVRPIPKPGSVNHIIDRMRGSELSG